MVGLIGDLQAKKQPYNKQKQGIPQHQTTDGLQLRKNQVLTCKSQQGHPRSDQVPASVRHMARYRFLACKMSRYILLGLLLAPIVKQCCEITPDGA